MLLNDSFGFWVTPRTHRTINAGSDSFSNSAFIKGVISGRMVVCCGGGVSPVASQRLNFHQEVRPGGQRKYWGCCQWMKSGNRWPSQHPACSYIRAYCLAIEFLKLLHHHICQSPFPPILTTFPSTPCSACSSGLSGEHTFFSTHVLHTRSSSQGGWVRRDSQEQW